MQGISYTCVGRALKLNKRKSNHRLAAAGSLKMCSKEIVLLKYRNQSQGLLAEGRSKLESCSLRIETTKNM